MLKKYVENFGTQQSVLEHALESLENSSDPDLGLPPDEEEVWMRLGHEIKGTLTLLQVDITRQLFKTADIERFKEYFKDGKTIEFILEWYLDKPLKEFSLQEVMDVLTLNTKIQGGSDTVNCIEDDDFYKLNITHNMGINCSKIIVAMYESVFKSYGVRFEVQFSQRSIFFTVFK